MLKVYFVRFEQICKISARRALYIIVLDVKLPVRSRFARRFSSTAEGKVKSHSKGSAVHETYASTFSEQRLLDE